MSSKKKNKAKKAKKKSTTVGETDVLVIKKKKKVKPATMLSIDLDTMADELVSAARMDSTVMATPDEIQDDILTIKTVTVVAEVATYYTKGDLSTPTGKKKLGCGRAAAQAGHAVSKLKDSYAQYNELKAGFMQQNPITNIVLKARDSEELRHIIQLADERNVHAVEFRDSGKEFYGTDGTVLTAIALGPVTDGSYLSGITDYLPKWA